MWRAKRAALRWLSFVIGDAALPRAKSGAASPRTVQAVVRIGSALLVIRTVEIRAGVKGFAN